MSEIQHKMFAGAEIKAAQGLAVAVFSRFNVKDKDGDVTLSGAIRDGAETVIGAYQHTSWKGALPVGRGRIRTTRTEARVEAQFFMDTASGRDTFAVVRELAELGEWSYGYDVLEASKGRFEGENVQFLKRLHVSEVSPVLVGAGVATMTESAKGVLNEYGRYMRSLYDDRQRDELAEIQQRLELTAIKEAL